MIRSFVWGAVMLSIVAACLILTTSTVTAEPLSIEQPAKPAASAGMQIPPEVRDAMTRFQNRDVAGAVAVLDKAVAANPQLPPTNVIVAQFCGTSNQARPAVRYWLEKAIVDTPQDPEAYVMLGRMALQEKRSIEAELLFDKAGGLLANFKGDAKRKASMEQAVLGQSSQLAMKRKDWKTAREKLEALLKLNPENASALIMLASTLFEEKKPEEALEKLEVAVSIDKDTLSPQARMARWWEAAGDSKKAGEAMVEALNANPKDFKIRIAAAEWALKAKSFDQARLQADIAIKLDPDSLAAKLLAGNIALFQKDYPAAIKYYQEVLTREPQNFTASNNLALALCDQGGEKNIQLAGQYASINAKLYAKQAEPYSTLGWVLFKMNKLRESEQALRRAAAGGRIVAPDTAFYLANVYAATNREAEAKKLLESALNAKGLFSEREAAQELLKKLGG